MSHPFASQQSIRAAFDEWWGSIARKGDPIRRPYLVEEAFLAGMQAAIAELNKAETERKLISITAKVDPL